MDEVWERAVETALDGQTDCASARSLTLDGAVKCFQGRLPPPSLLEKFQSLEQLSIANVGVSSLERFPNLRNLQKLILSDNRIAGGLEFLVEAGLESLRDLDLSNNRIQYLEDLAPLAHLRLVSLDLYECPVTRIKDYRSRVFGLIKSLKYLDKMDADENERPESDDEEEDEEDDEEDDPGSGEIDGEDRSAKMSNGGNVGDEDILDVDEDEESDADEEETETARTSNGLTQDSHHHSNGFRVAASTDGDGDGDGDEDDEDEDDLGEEIDEEGEDEDVVEVHEIEDSDEDEDGVEEEDDEDEEEEEVEDEEDYPKPESTGRLPSTEGEIDGHEQGEEDENGEIGEEEEQSIEDDGEYEEEDGEDEEEDYGADYLVRPVGQAEEDVAEASDLDPGNEEDDVEEEVEDEEDQNGRLQLQPSSSSQLKRKRDEEQVEDEDDDDDDSIEDAKLSKHQ